MNRDEVIEELVAKYREALEEKDDEDLLGNTALGWDSGISQAERYATEEESDHDAITILEEYGIATHAVEVDGDQELKPANVKLYRVHRDRMVVVELIVTLEAHDDDDAVEKAMAEIKAVLPHDDLFGQGAWRWEADEVDWLEKD